MIQTTTRNDELAAKHKRFVLTPWVAQGAHTAPTIVRGEGVRIFDADGNAYLDLSSGLGREPISATVIRASSPRYASKRNGSASFPRRLFSDVRAQLAEELIALAPWPEGGRAYFHGGRRRCERRCDEART